MATKCSIQKHLDIPVEIHELENGLRIFFMPMKGVGMSYIQYGTRVGMDAEDKKSTWEAAHAIEHMLGCFTSQSSKNSKKVSEEIDLRGVKSNATTKRDSVVYWMKGLQEHTDWMLKTVCDSCAHPYMDPKVFKQEMMAITQELRSDIGDTWHDLDAKMFEVLFKGLPFSVHTQKKLDNVSKLKLTLLKKLRAQWYQPQLMTLYLAGAVNKKQLAFSKDVLGALKRGLTESPCVPEIPRRLGNVTSVVQKTKNHNVGLRIVFPIVIDLFDYRRAIEIDCIEFILSNGFSSRLYKVLRTRLGLVYSVGFSSTTGHNPNNSFVCISTECEQTKLLKVIEEVCSVVKKFSKQGPTDTEIQKWRDHVRMDSLEDSLISDPSDFVSDYDDYLRWADKYPKNISVKRMSLAINQGDVRQASNKIFDKGCMIFHTGKNTVDPKIEKVIKKSFPSSHK